MTRGARAAWAGHPLGQRHLLGIRGSGAPDLTSPFGSIRS
jgi:hypothetical protein